MSVPQLFKLDREDRRASVHKLVEGASPNPEFYLLLVLSTVITTLGVILNSAPIVIGGMLVAPIISPILSMAMAIVMADFKVLFQSAKVLFYSISLVAIIALIISFLSVNIEANAEILSRAEPSIGYFVVAVAAGIAAAFAFARPSLSESIPGIAVTVALLPPLVVVAIAVKMLNYEIFAGSLGLFFLNLFGIVFAATIVFSLMGFYRLRDVAEKKLEKELENKNNGE